MGFKHCNCIVVFDRNKEKLLFCKRAKAPYKGLFNFVGGKLESNESSEHAAYRELFEETGIARKDIKLHRLMDMTYYQQKFVLEMYVGILECDVQLVEEFNSLEWIDIGDDFADSGKYAGDKNIAHIVEVAKLFDINSEENNRDLDEGFFVGVDGCKCGWIAASINHRELQIYKYTDFSELVYDIEHFNGMLVDMVMGLPSNIEQYDKRPDAICLAVTANLDEQGKTEIIPEKPYKDDKGLKMQMVIPKG